VRDPFARDDHFRRLIRGDEAVDPLLVNLEIARDVEPDLDFGPILTRIETLADRVRDRCLPGGGLRYIIGQINWVLYVEEGFRGDSETYDDPRNSYINEVLDRRLGLPIALAILYARVAAGAGLSLGLANLPMHFMLQVPVVEGHLFVDPFHEGRLLDREGAERFLAELADRPIRLGVEVLRPCTVAVTVARMLKNLKASYLDRKDFVSALPVVRRLAALCPDEPLEQRDWGMISLQVDRPGEALDPLQRYVDASPDAPDAEVIRRLLKSARREVAFRN
jgi:regulator of sirC expression with transglutaminase-like and TPR domain